MIQLAQSVLLLITAVVLADLVGHLSGSRKAGAVAGLLVVLYPPLVGFALCSLVRGAPPLPVRGGAVDSGQTM